MGKIMVLIFSDSEEYIMNKVLAAVESLPTMEYISNHCMPSILTFSNLEIRIHEQTVYRNGIRVPLSHHEFFTLTYLASHPSWVFSKEQIYEAVWNDHGTNCDSAVTNVVSQIRRKIGDGYIKTVIGSGYKFEV